MKRRHTPILCILSIVLFSIFGCHRKEMVPNLEQQSITAILDGTGTKAYMIQEDNTLNLLGRWNPFESFDIYYLNTDGYKEIYAEAQVSEEHSKATISYSIPKSLINQGAYSALIFTKSCWTTLEDQEIYVNASIQRKALEDFQAPVYFKGSISQQGTQEVVFCHYYTYELLHLKNNTDDDIDFVEVGFEATNKWYKENGSICISNGKFISQGPGHEEPMEFSTPMSVNPGESSIMLSAYIPNGQKIKDATLVARINGKTVKSSNMKSSNATLQTGHAYHMYAEWDGKELKFVEAPKDEAVELSSDKVEFDEVAVGKSDTKKITVRNVGLKPIVFSLSANGGSKAFSWKPSEQVSLSPGENTEIEIIFTPDKEGEHSCNIDVSLNGTSCAAVINCTGKALKEEDVINLVDGLVAYYPFNGNTKDESGNKHDGTIVGNLDLTADRFGKANSAYLFPGSSWNYISVPHSEDLMVDEFTISAWIYSDSEDKAYGGGNKKGYIVCKGRDINNGSYHLCASNVCAAVQYGGTNDAYMEGIPEIGTWHLVTGTVKGDVASFYLDGSLKDERKLSESFKCTTTEILVIGTHYFSGSLSSYAYPHYGIIDDVRIYNRVLSPANVKALYDKEKNPNGGTGGSVSGGGSGFGDGGENAGNVSGGGTGYDEGKNEDISGGGTGYQEEQGSISGSGTGYN